MEFIELEPGSESSSEQMKKLQDELDIVKKELNILKEEYNKLKKSSNNKQEIIDNNLAHGILASISKTNNLTKTAKEFNCDPAEIFYSIPCWDDCNDRLYELEDYEFHNYKIYGRENFLGDHIQTIQYNDLEKYNQLMRTPGQEELDKIFFEYQNTEITLYGLADKYNLLIINLFRLLKEHKLIEKESDSIGYDEFYKEYIGEFEYNKYDIKTNLGLIDMFYYYLNKPKID